MSYVTGVAIADTFILRDGTDTAITGKTSGDFATIEAYDVAAPGTTAAVALVEIGNGEYGISFTPTTPTSGSDRTWTAHVVYNSGGVFREWSESWPVSAAAVTTTVITVPVAPASGSSFTRAQLRDMVARRFGDLVQLTATAPGSTTTFVDIQRVSVATPHFTGRDLLFTGGHNVGTVRVITNTNASTGTLTFSAVSDATVGADTASVYNNQSGGFTVQEYNDAINDAIRAAFPLAVIAVQVDITSPFDTAVPEIDLPAELYEIESLEYQTSDGRWIDLPRGRNGFGWTVDRSLSQLRLEGYPASLAGTATLRAFGTGRQPELDDDTDTCVLNESFIVAHCVYQMAMGAIGRDVKFERIAGAAQGEMERARTAVRTMRKPTTRKVVAA